MSDSATLQRIEALVQRLALDNAQLRATIGACASWW